MNTRPTIPKKTRRAVFAESDGACVYCGGKATEIDHIFPYSFEFTHRRENLVASCATCNRLASNKNFDSFIDKMTYIRKERVKRGLNADLYFESMPTPKRVEPKPKKQAKRDTRLKAQRKKRIVDPTIPDKLNEILDLSPEESKNKKCGHVGEMIGLGMKGTMMISNGGYCGADTEKKILDLHKRIKSGDIPEALVSAWKRPAQTRERGNHDYTETQRKIAALAAFHERSRVVDTYTAVAVDISIEAEKYPPYDWRYPRQVELGSQKPSDEFVRAVDAAYWKMSKPEIFDPWIPALIAFALLCVGIGVLIGVAL